MRNVMLPLALGVMLLSVTGCRSNPPPPVFSEICLGDGFGGADCSLPNGGRKYHKPSELKNYWMAPQADMQNFTAWCYGISPASAGVAMDSIKAVIEAGARD